MVEIPGCINIRRHSTDSSPHNTQLKWLSWYNFLPYKIVEDNVINKKCGALDCDQSNVYSSRVIFSVYFSNLSFLSFSLYCKSVHSPIITVNSHYRVRGQSMVSIMTVDACDRRLSLISQDRITTH